MRPAEISLRDARRLALARAALLKPEWTDLPSRAPGRGKRARRAVHAVIDRFGYLQLDSVSIAGARTHGIVLLSRLEGLDPALAEELLRPGEPLFEYWGHEASWIPLDLYPAFAPRRREFQEHPWWGDVLGEHPKLHREILRRIRDDGPLRTAELNEKSTAWWGHGPAKKVVATLWSAGELAVRERRGFQRVFDLEERVIPAAWRRRELDAHAARRILLERALEGHGWATTGTLAATWRFRGQRAEVDQTLAALVEEGRALPCDLVDADGGRTPGWIRPADLELAERLRGARPRRDRGVLLSPFDPVLWDRPRVKKLFDFEQILEIYKPAPQRIYGYYCLPILAADRLVGRVDLKADRAAGTLRLLATHFENAPPKTATADRRAARSALERYAGALGLEVEIPPDW